MPIALDPAAVALLLLMIVAGATYMLRVVSMPVRASGIPGASILANALDGAATTITAWARGWLDPAAKPLGDLLSGIATHAYSYLQGVVNGIVYLLGAMVSYAEQLRTQGLTIDANKASAEALAEQQGAAAQHLARTLTANEALDRESAVAHATAQAQAYAEGLAGQLERTLAADVARAEAVAMANVAVAEKAAAGALAAAVAVLDREIAGIDGKVGDIATSLAPLLTLALPTVIPLTITEVQQLQKDVRDCCGPSVPTTPSGLTGVVTLAELLAVLGLVAEGVAHPEAAAKDLEGAVSPFITAAKGIASAVGLSI